MKDETHEFLADVVRRIPPLAGGCSFYLFAERPGQKNKKSKDSDDAPHPTSRC